ncbi:hypothetical protein ACOME3_009831 [Neoechinorhynchus agilis]
MNNITRVITTSSGSSMSSDSETATIGLQINNNNDDDDDRSPSISTTISDEPKMRYRPLDSSSLSSCSGECWFVPIAEKVECNEQKCKGCQRRCNAYKISNKNQHARISDVVSCFIRSMDSKLVHADQSIASSNCNMTTNKGNFKATESYICSDMNQTSSLSPKMTKPQFTNQNQFSKNANETLSDTNILLQVHLQAQEIQQLRKDLLDVERKQIADDHTLSILLAEQKSTKGMISINTDKDNVQSEFQQISAELKGLSDNLKEVKIQLEKLVNDNKSFQELTEERLRSIERDLLPIHEQFHKRSSSTQSSYLTVSSTMAHCRRIDNHDDYMDVTDFEGSDRMSWLTEQTIDKLLANKRKIEMQMSKVPLRC